MNLGGVLNNLVWGAGGVRNRLDDMSMTEPRWSDEEIVEALSNAEEEIARRTYCIEDDVTLTLSAAISSYAISGLVLTIGNGTLGSDNSIVYKRDVDWLNQYRSNWKTITGKPSDYAVKDNSVLVTPIPDSAYDSDTIGLRIARTPTYRLSSTNLTPEISSMYYKDMINYACFELKLKRDVDTFDPTGSVDFYTLFQASVGRRSDINIERIVRTQAEGLRIRVQT